MSKFSFLGLVIFGVLSLAGCKKGLDQQQHPVAIGEVVSVNLDLALGGTLTPENEVSGASEVSGNGVAGSASSAQRVVASERVNGMVLEVVQEPMEIEQMERAATGAQTRAVSETVVSNFWVFQYNGSANNSVLIFKKYYSSYTAGQKVDMVKGRGQNVVIVANTFNPNFGDAQVVGSSTLTPLLNLTSTLTQDPNSPLTNGGSSMIFSGSKVSDILNGSALVCPLIRTVASITVGVKLGTGATGITANKWTVQLTGISNKNNFFYDPAKADDQSILMPTAVTTIDFPFLQATFNSSTFTNYQWYTSVNRRGLVAEATRPTRLDKAPAGCMKLKITGYRDNNTVQYSIPLGANFTTDYNIRANYKYTYKITIYDDPSDIDSQVEVVPTSKVIYGLRWATGNLICSGNNSAIIGMPTDGGLYFQFGSLVGWTGGSSGDGVGIPPDNVIPAKDQKLWPSEMGAGKPTYAWQSNDVSSISTFNNYYFNYNVAPYQTSGTNISSYPGLMDGALASKGIGDPCRYYLGNAWRTPIDAEYQKLFGNVPNDTPWASIVGGSWSSTPPSGGNVNGLFFPAIGARTNTNGLLDFVGQYATYWSMSVASPNTAYSFTGVYSFAKPRNNYFRSNGFPVRCVSGVELTSDQVNNSVTSKAQNFTLTIKGIEKGDSWTMTETDDATGAFTPSATSGSANGTITVAVTKNATNAWRQASYKITTASGLTETTLTIKQPNESILAGGLRWATGNLVATKGTQGGVTPGTTGSAVTIGMPTDGGLYFQCGSLIGYKGGNIAGQGRGIGIPDGAMLTDGKAWNGQAFSWSNDAMVWPHVFTLTTNSFPKTTTLNYYFGLGTSPYDKKGERFSSYSGWEAGTLVSSGQAAGDPCRYYLGGTWRTPTTEDFARLFNDKFPPGTVGAVDGWPGEGGDWTYGSTTKTVKAGMANNNNGNPGVGFYANTTATNETAAAADPNAIFFGAIGYRSIGNGSINYVGRGGYYWSTSILRATRTFYLEYTNAVLYGRGSSERDYAYPIRCVSNP